MAIRQVGTSGNDTLVGVNGQSNELIGDTLFLQGTTGGNDTLTGGADGENYLYGDALTLAGGGATGGDDTLTGGKNSINFLYGDGLDANGPANGGHDRLVSAAGTTDHMWGDFGGTTGPATFGNDRFVFGRNNGTDTIYDFHHGEDIIEINTSALPSRAAGRVPQQAAQHIPAPSNFPDSFEELQISEVNGSSIIDLGGGNSITVAGVTGLTASDFDFVI